MLRLLAFCILSTGRTHRIVPRSAFVAGLAEVSEVAFLRNVVQLQRRGLVQQRGKWRAVLPHAISNRLAANAVEMYPPELLNRLVVDDASDRVARSFSRRLGYLHESKRAAELVSSWLKPHGRLGGLAKLNDLDRAIFSNVAPVSEETAWPLWSGRLRTAISRLPRIVADMSLLVSRDQLRMTPRCLTGRSMYLSA